MQAEGRAGLPNNAPQLLLRNRLGSTSSVVHCLLHDTHAREVAVTLRKRLARTGGSELPGCYLCRTCLRVAHHALNLLTLHPGKRKQAVIHFQVHLRGARAPCLEQHGVSSAGTRLANDVQPVAEQQVEVAVDAPLRADRKSADAHASALKALTPSEFSIGSTARSTRNCSTA